MVGIPGTEERLALAEVEDRLRRIRGRFNLYTVQHHVYSFGTAAALGAAALIVCAFTLSPLFFTLVAWPLLAVLVFLLLFFCRRSLAGWANLVTAARRVDARAGLKERLSTLVAQLSMGVIGKPPPSRLWLHLLADNTSHLSDWEIKKVAPRRVPWSVFPFLIALLLALSIAFVPLLSSPSQPNPFSLANLGDVLAEFPDRTSAFLDRQFSLLPDPPEQWGKSGMFDSAPAPSPQASALGNTTDSPAQDAQFRTLASLPEALQKAIRQALQEPIAADSPSPGNQGSPPDPNARLALRPAGLRHQDAQQAFTVEGQDLPSGARKGPSAPHPAGKGQDMPPGSGGLGQAPDQGSGLQQLGRARLGRQNPPGTFRPQGPQIPGRGGQAGSGGPGAGRGTDPRLFGAQTNLEAGADTFQLALDATYEPSHGSDAEGKYEGDVAEKSGRNLSQRQSLDDAIRKARVPPEYETIVKRLFSRGGSQ